MPFEPILLKKLTHSGDFFGKVTPIIESEFFNNVGNQELFKLIKSHYNSYKDIPSLTELVAQVKDVPNAEIRKEIITSLQVINTTEEVQNTDFMVDETVSFVKDALYFKALQIGSDGLMNKNEELKLKAQEIMDKRAKIQIDSDLGLDFDDIDAMIAYYSERNIGIRTQHDCFNKRLGVGFIPGTLSIILAAAGIGKSLLMTDLISGIIKKNKNILLVSLEMQDKEIMKRVHANAMDLPINSLLDLNKTPGELKQLKRPFISKEDVISAYNKMKTSGDCGKLFIKDYPAGSFSPLMLEQLVNSYKIEKNVEFDMVFVDYLGIMKSDLISPSAGLYSYLKSIGEELRATAKVLNVPIVSASQLNRGAVNSTEADNSNISDSIGTAMTADWMLFLLQDAEMKERKEIVCKVTKNRFNGRTDTWMMNIDYEKMRFTEMSLPEDAELQSITEPQANNIEDFGIITSQKQEHAEAFAEKEIREIRNNDTKIIMEQKNNPLNSSEDLFKELGL